MWFIKDITEPIMDLIRHPSIINCETKWSSDDWPSIWELIGVEEVVDGDQSNFDEIFVLVVFIDTPLCCHISVLCTCGDIPACPVVSIDLSVIPEFKVVGDQVCVQSKA